MTIDTQWKSASAATEAGAALATTQEINAASANNPQPEVVGLGRKSRLPVGLDERSRRPRKAGEPGAIPAPTLHPLRLVIIMSLRGFIFCEIMDNDEIILEQTT